MDALAVATAASLALNPVSGRQIFRLSFHFGLFQFLMPVAGWSIAREFAATCSRYDHWIAFFLLSFIGAKMIREAFHQADGDTKTDPPRGMTMIMLSIATSIDAFAVGLSLAFLNVSIWLPSAVIGIVTAALSSFGMVCASRFGHLFGRWAEVLGGLVLLFIGLEVLISHLISG